MKAALVVTLLSASLAGCGVIDQGDIGVRTQFGHVQQGPVGTGFYTSLLSSVAEFTTKETTVTLDGLTPRARDNLTLRELDATIYYKADGSKLPQFEATHSGQSGFVKGEKAGRPGCIMIDNVARGIIMDEVSHYDSLTLHLNRQSLEAAVAQKLQDQLNLKVPGVFTITNVVVRSIQTDPAVEQSIRDSAAATKRLETATKLVQVKQQEALANEQVGKSLSPAFLQHEYNEALNKCAANSNCTMIVGAGQNAIVTVKGSTK